MHAIAVGSKARFRFYFVLTCFLPNTLLLSVLSLMVTIGRFSQCRWTDGRVYKGNWVEGKASGYGVEIRPDGSIRHDGQWEDDKPIRNHDNDNKSNSNDDDTGTK